MIFSSSPRRWMSGGLMCLVAVFACAGEAGTGGDAGRLPEVRLDLRPFQEPVSTYIIFGTDGAVRSVQYSPSRFFVMASAEGDLPLSARERAAARLASPELWQAMKRRQPPAGLQPGDLYRLRLSWPGGGAVESGGFLADAPPAVQSAVDEIRRLAGAHTRPAAPAAAYLRSEPIEPRRLDRIRERGMVRLLAMSEIPPDLRPPLAQAARQPFDFIPIQRGTYDRLLPFTSHGHELFVLDDGEGHQVALFELHTL